MVVLLHNFKNIFLVAELRKKIAYTIAMLAVFRFGVHIQIPGIDVVALKNLFNSGAAGSFLNYFDLFFYLDR